MKPNPKFKRRLYRAIRLLSKPKEGAIMDGVPLPPSLRPMTLTAEEAERMRQLLEDPNIERHAGREMETK